MIITTHILIMIIMMIIIIIMFSESHTPCIPVSHVEDGVSERAQH